MIATAVIVVAVILLLFFTRGGETPLAEALAKAGIAEPVNEHAPLYTGEAWKPAAEADGFAKALENDRYTFYVRPDNTQIALVDKASGYRWTSNPTQEQLANETVKGLPLANLQSTFVLTYVTTGGKDQTIRKTVNSFEKKVIVSMVKTDAGLQIAYDYPDLKLGLAIQYELTPSGLKVRVPTDGIKEEGNFIVFTLDLLPYFGAAAAGEDGYIFLPDGPGGLVKFDAKRSDISRGYLHQVYGLEPTNMNNFSRSGERRENITYPVYGVKNGDNAFVAILTKGADSARIAANPPGITSMFYNAFSNQIYREDYLYFRSKKSVPVKAVQKDRLQTDRELEFRFISGKDAGYVGMADAYRDYLTETGGIGKQLEPVAHIPLYLKILGGSAAEQYNQIKYIPATTFAQATEMVKDLQAKGVANMEVVYFGWQNLGGYETDNRFPIESKLGGASAAKRFISEMKESNIPVSFYDDFVWLNTDTTSLSPSTSGIRGIEGTTFVDMDNWFLSKPARTVDMAYKAIRKLKEIGASGVHYNWIGEMVFNDYDPGAISSRGETIDIYQGLLNYTRETLGKASVWRGNAYSLSDVTFIDNLPYDKSYDFMIDEAVPFYPIVVHGFVPYTFDEGNFRNDVEEEFLKAIEYGALPSYFLTHDEARKLKNTEWGLWSSHFAKWADRIGVEYQQFDKLSKLYSQKIVGHEKLSEKVFATTYEDGTRVVVDYNKLTFEVEGGGGA
ncbi:DUF5696 domain-containing protein [Cohnella sp. GCM10027633]|uniref:DUF5696 domain-containing protein n=1 Tax=unclassified Cohnella TaxID=2636738 RepID=UPI00362E58AF